MTPHPQQENPDMICSAFHRISVVQPENCYNCVHRHGYPQYLFGDENCSSFIPIRSRPTPAAPIKEITCPHCLKFFSITEHDATIRNQTLDAFVKRVRQEFTQDDDEEWYLSAYDFEDCIDEFKNSDGDEDER